MKENLSKETLLQKIDRLLRSLAPAFLAMIATQSGTILPPSVAKELDKQSK